MKRVGGSDHLASSLTDLMTSLMVIFVLLLVTQLNNRAGRKESAVNYILEKLEAHAVNMGDEEKPHREGDAIVIRVPDKILSFKQAPAEQGGAELPEPGRAYLASRIPRWAETLCEPSVKENIDTIVVEGHSDQGPFRGFDAQASKQENLKLSQQRSMAVVAESLSILESEVSRRECFLDLLSATGRGDAHPLNRIDLYSPQNRRVEFKIRVRPDSTTAIVQTTGGQAR